MRTDLLADGVQCELSTDYHHLVLRNYLCVRRLAALNRIAVPSEMDAHMQKALEFSAYIHKPDGFIPSLSDGDTGSFLDLLEHGSRLYDCPGLQYVASRGKEGKPPECRSKAFKDSGYYILRSGWGERDEPYEDERYLVFDCGPLGAGNHGHLDLLSFEMAAYGQSLVVDPGRYTYDESGDTNWRVLFRGTANHNTVLVDGKNQTRYIAGVDKFRIKGPAPDYELRTFVSNPSFDYLHGIARSHEYSVIHERKIFFLCPEYWIISDLLRSKELHDYRLLYHLSPQAYGKVSIHTKQSTVLADSPHLVIAQPLDRSVTPVIDEGYVSPTYGVKHAAPVLQFACRATNACYHTVMFPYKKVRPEITVEQLPVRCGTAPCAIDKASALRIAIKTNGRRYEDCYFIRHQEVSGEFTFEGFTCQSALRFTRTDGAGKVVRDISSDGITITGDT
jgi:hypothetical protein